MITRRTFFKNASVAAISVRTGWGQQVPNSSGVERPRLKAPLNACDCHHHIYDAARFAPIQQGGEIIPNARVEEFRLLKKRIGTERSVVVTPRAYVTDNRVTLDAIERLGPNARGVEVVGRWRYSGYPFLAHRPKGRVDVVRNDRAFIEAGNRAGMACANQYDRRSSCLGGGPVESITQPNCIRSSWANPASAACIVHRNQSTHRERPHVGKVVGHV